MFEVTIHKENEIKNYYYFNSPGEAYIAMLNWAQTSYAGNPLRAFNYSREINSSFDVYDENKKDDWFGIAGVITCKKTEETNKVDAPAQVISKDMFIKWVKEIKKIKDNYEIFLDQVYEIFGSSAQDAICNAMNEGNLIEMLADFVGDKNQTLSYYFYELDCDFSEFDKYVELEGAPSVKDYGDLYDFIMYENGVTNVSDDDDDSGWEDYD